MKTKHLYVKLGLPGMAMVERLRAQAGVVDVSAVIAGRLITVRVGSPGEVRAVQRRESVAERCNARRAAWRLAGLCSHCGARRYKVASNRGSTRCASCRKMHRKARRRYLRRLRGEASGAVILE